MSHQGRSSAAQAIILASALLISVFLQFNTSRGASFTVGDSKGWDFNIQSWEDGKNCKAGDIFVFNYDSSFHNVVTVDASGYNSRTANPSSRSYATGQGKIKLNKGKNYYICSIPGHCDGGLKLLVEAS